ncbi:PDZ domain-containing protein [Oceanicoccus sagamiensis]|nr:PDZ domain-containing protein [Oceanicoccus sagamiensis]
MGIVTQRIIYTLLGGLISAGLVLTLTEPPQPATPAASTNTAPPLADNVENTDITQLQQTIAKLQQQLHFEQENTAALDYELQLLEDLLADASSPTPPRPTNRKNRAAETWFDESRLLALNVDPADIETIKTLHNQAELEKLELRNKAARDAKLRRSLYRELKTIDSNLRQQLGEQNYDRMLFASGKRNRVEVTDILTGSAANSTGIQKGDLIISYGGERIYEPANLYQSTAGGDVGEMTLVEIQRGEEVLTVYVPRGPLGTRFKPIVKNPD